jgi:hypothetical protein
VRLLLATNHLGLGGSESYLLTVAEQLQRLGHESVLLTAEGGPGLAVAAERGVPCCEEIGAREDFDAALVQDAAVSHEVARSRPSLPQLFVAHSESFDLQSPPQFGDAVRVVVALNDRVEARMRSFAVQREVVRLRQPIDSERFLPRAALPERARRVLLLSNTPHLDRIGMIASACVEAGLELHRLGGLNGQTTDPREALHRAEIVIGYGRSVLEAMACGRAAYVYDWNGGDGWVTAESYPAIESDGFGGRTGEMIIDGERLRDDLRAYSAAMGPVNHDLVLGRHRANVHAQELVGLLGRLGTLDAAPPAAPVEEMARLVRLEWRARADVHALRTETAELSDRLVKTDAKLSEALRAAQIEAKKGQQLARAYEATLSWRLTAPLRRLGSLFRKRR